MRSLGVLVAILIASNVVSHPHFGGGYPRFYNEERPLDQPTVNVFKIYAPRLFYMPGYKADGKKQDNFFNKNKQMYSGNENILDNMLQPEMFPDALFDEEAANAAYQYDHNFVPAPSNIVSRKLPLYAPLSLPPMMGGDFGAPSMHLDDFRPSMGSDPTNFMNDGPQFIPDYFDMNEDYCEHHEMFHDMNTPMNQEYSDYPNMQFMDPIFINEAPRPNGPNNGGQGPIAAALFTPNPAGPLTSFFKKFVSEPKKEDKLMAQLMTTVTYGNPELVEEGGTIESQLKANEEDEKNNEEIDIIVAEEFTQDTPDETTVEEVERNFVKTILPDNTFVTEEVSNEETDKTANTDDIEDENSDIPVEEVEVNIVKTILPDDSYLVSEAGGENEKIQDEVITMIQNAEGTPQDGSEGNIFISRYLDTPKV